MMTIKPMTIKSMPMKYLLVAAVALTGAAVMIPAAQAGEKSDQIIVKGERMSSAEARKKLRAYLSDEAGSARIIGSWVRQGYYYAKVSNNRKFPTATYRVDLETGKIVRLKAR